MKRNAILVVLGLMLATLILSACGSTSKAESNFPTGKFVLSDSQYEGVYFNKDGTWSGFAFGQTIAQGKYHVKGDLYTEEASPDGCQTDATYKYSFDGTNLKFELVGSDDCQNRRESLDGVTYVLTKE
jgi:major membrane immunogen (membrane-anchored lipoprotein)